MTTKKVLIFSHIPQRDDTADVLIKQACEKLGLMTWKYPILAGPRNALTFLKPDVVVFPEIRCEATMILAKNLKQWGCKILQRRCEMGISAETELNDELSRALYGNHPIWNLVDIDFVWGPKFAEMLDANNVMPRSKIEVIGGIGFDQYFLPKPPVVKSAKKTVVFATGFGYADRNEIYAIPEAKTGERIHSELVKQDIAWRLDFIELIKSFQLAFPDWDINVRRHPGDGGDIYQRSINGMVDCSSEPPPFSLARADLLVHTGSTMAYEAHLCNVPSFNYKNTSMDKAVGAIAPTFNTQGELLAAVKTLEFGKSNADPQAIKNLEENYYGKVDGKAHERIAEVIARVAQTANANVPDAWPADKFQFPSEGVSTIKEVWTCGHCGNVYSVEPGRETVKCPFCGIANVRKVG